MSSRWTESQIIESATRIVSTLEIDKPISRISDVDVNFFERVLQVLTGFVRDENNAICERLESCITEVSKFIRVPLPHITAPDLISFRPSSLGYFLEIIEFLVDYSCEEQKEESGPLIKSFDSFSEIINGNTSDTSIERSHSAISPSNVTSITYNAEDLIQNASNSHMAVNCTTDMSGYPPRETLEPHSDDVKSSTLDRNTSIASSSSSTQENFSGDARLIYLREKLRQCLSSLSDNSPMTGPLSTESDRSPTPSDLSDEEESGHRKHQLSPAFPSVQSPGPGGTRKSSKSFVKMKAQPLVCLNHRKTRKRACLRSTARPLCRSGRKYPDALPSTGLLDRVLEAFPLLDLNEHDRRVFRRKAVNSLGMPKARPMGDISSHSSTTDTQSVDRKLTWYEERQRRQLAQLIRHEFQADRLRNLRANEAADRRIREEARDRRHQLVRARNYYRQFVHEFRARKLAKMTEEEQVFRRFFDCLLAREKEGLLELQRLEREEKRKKDQIREQALLGLEHSHRVRMTLVSESIRREREEQLARARDEQQELNRQKRELRRLLELNIHEMQQTLLSNHDSAYFREADAKRILNNAQHLIR